MSSEIERFNMYTNIVTIKLTCYKRYDGIYKEEVAKFYKLIHL